MQAQFPQVNGSESIEEILIMPHGSIAVVDIGAAFFGQNQLYENLIRRDLANVVAFEPDIREIESLRNALGPAAKIVPKALGDGSKHILHLGPPNSGMSSLFKPDRDYLGYFNKFESFGRVIETLMIETTRLDDCAEVGEIDFIRMDIQGSELSVLRNGIVKLQNCAVVQLEISFVPLYEGQPTFGEVDIFMREMGFIPHCFAELKRWSISPTVRDGNFKKPFNQLLEADIVYIKNIIKADVDADALKKIALIGHYCYGSIDLAARCILLLIKIGAVPQEALEKYYKLAGHDPRPTL